MPGPVNASTVALSSAAAGGATARMADAGWAARRRRAVPRARPERRRITRPFYMRWGPRNGPQAPKRLVRRSVLLRCGCARCSPRLLYGDDAAAGHRDEIGGGEAEDGVGMTGGGPDRVPLQEVLVDQRQDGLDVADR